MSFSYVPTKEELPGYFKPGRGKKLTNIGDSDFICPTCKKYVDVDAYFNNMLLRDCFICENGHRYHFGCVKIVTGENAFDRKYYCPKCDSPVRESCHSRNGYLYVPKTGGRKLTKRKRRYLSKKKPNKKKRTLKRR